MYDYHTSVCLNNIFRQNTTCTSISTTKSITAASRSINTTTTTVNGIIVEEKHAMLLLARVLDTRTVQLHTIRNSCYTEKLP